MRNYFNNYDFKDTTLGIGIIILVVILGLGLAFGLICFEGWLVMLLWNAILVPLFGIGALKFWWAVGLMFLCNILFGKVVRIGGNKNN